MNTNIEIIIIISMLVTDVSAAFAGFCPSHGGIHKSGAAAAPGLIF
jgi:hypothetical protein